MIEEILTKYIQNWIKKKKKKYNNKKKNDEHKLFKIKEEI